MNSRFTMAVHVLGMLAWAERQGEGPVTSTAMAASINTHPVVVRRVLAQLQDAGLVRARRGVRGGVTLARPAAEITLKDAYQAVEGASELLGRYPHQPSAQCQVGQGVSGVLAETVCRAEAAMLAQLEGVSLEALGAELAARLKA